MSSQDDFNARASVRASRVFVIALHAWREPSKFWR
jgi:hypothetical protein